MEEGRGLGATAEEKKASGSRQMWRLVLGGAVGYSLGRLLLDKPMVGLVLGVAVAFLIGSSDEEAG
jgi:hypothetical protein